MGILKVLLMLLICHLSQIYGVPRQYRSNQELTEHMRNVSEVYSDITYLYSIGQSLHGAELMVLAISAVHPDKHIILRPEGKYVGNMHGNEAGSRELLLDFIDFLVQNYPSDDRVKSLLESSRIHIVPTLNPDGFNQSREGDCSSSTGRYNADGYDLNRVFPDLYHGEVNFYIPELFHVKDWMRNNQFVLSANFHSGSAVVNYPYDSFPDLHLGSIPNLCPDDDTFQHLAKEYSLNHRSLVGTICSFDSSNFKDGITNGADWYIIRGSMQDYNYVFAGCMEVTVELTCCKYPIPSTLEQQWLDNEEALMAYLSNINRGVKGVVYSSDGLPIRNASVIVDQRQHVKTTPLGEYWKILLPGNYTLKIALDDTVIHSSALEVVSDIQAVLNVTLPHSSRYYSNLVGSASHNNILYLPFYT